MVYSMNSLVSPSSVRGKETGIVGGTNGNIDLNLSLSLNGRFGFDPHRNHRVIGSSSHSNVLIPPEKRSTVIFAENGASKRRSLDTIGSSTISFVQYQTIDGQGFPANIGCLAAKNRGKSVEVVAEKILSKAIPAKQGKGGEFKRLADMPNVFTTISGRQYKGYLSKYGEEEVCILCARHAYSRVQLSSSNMQVVVMLPFQRDSSRSGILWMMVKWLILIKQII